MGDEPTTSRHRVIVIRYSKDSLPGVEDEESGAHLAVARPGQGAAPQLLQQHHDRRDQLGTRGLQRVDRLRTPVPTDLTPCYFLRDITDNF